MQPTPEPAVNAHRLMREISGTNVWAVHAPALIAGDYEAVRGPFDALGVELSYELASEWIDPSLWGACA